MQKSKTARGVECIVFKGFRYRAIKKRLNIFRCTVKTSKGRARIVNDKLTELNTKHNHTTNIFMKREVRNKIIQKSTSN
jgi:hypothetical protein